MNLRGAGELDAARVTCDATRACETQGLAWCPSTCWRRGPSGCWHSKSTGALSQSSVSSAGRAGAATASSLATPKPSATTTSSTTRPASAWTTSRWPHGLKVRRAARATWRATAGGADASAGWAHAARGASATRSQRPRRRSPPVVALVCGRTRVVCGACNGPPHSADGAARRLLLMGPRTTPHASATAHLRGADAARRARARSGTTANPRPTALAAMRARRWLETRGARWRAGPGQAVRAGGAVLHRPSRAQRVTKDVWAHAAGTMLRARAPNSGGKKEGRIGCRAARVGR